MTEVTIRAPRHDDIARLAEINLIGWRHTYAHLLSEEYFASMPAQLEAKWQSIVNANPPRVKVAEIDGEVVGHAGALDRPAPEAVRPVELLFIYQLPEMHGSGTGQALLDAVIGDEPASLWVAEDNPRARRFYERNGFVPDGERRIEESAENMAAVRLVR